MLRKLIKQGRGGYTIYLPPEWITNNNLEYGDLVKLSLERDNIILTSPNKDFTRSVAVTVDSNNESIISIIIQNLYVQGFHKIRLTYENDTQRKLIEKEIYTNTIGFEIISNKNNEILIENVTEPEKSKQDILFKRCIHILNESFDLLIEDLKRSSFENISEIKLLTKRANTYSSFCKRIALQDNGFSTIHSFMIPMQRNFLHLYQELENNKKKIDKNVIELATQAKTLCKELFYAFIKHDLKKYSESAEALRKFWKKDLLKEMSKQTGINSEVLFYITTIVRNSFSTYVNGVSNLINMEVGANAN